MNLFWKGIIEENTTKSRKELQVINEMKQREDLINKQKKWSDFKERRANLIETYLKAKKRQKCINQVLRVVKTHTTFFQIYNIFEDEKERRFKK
jgi:hypothetical protein